MSDFAVTVASLAVAVDFSDNSSNVIYRPSEPQAANINYLISNDKIFMRNINYKDVKAPPCAQRCARLNVIQNLFCFIFYFNFISFARENKTYNVTKLKKGFGWDTPTAEAN